MPMDFLSVDFLSVDFLSVWTRFAVEKRRNWAGNWTTVQRGSEMAQAAARRRIDGGSVLDKPISCGYKPTSLAHRRRKGGLFNP